LPNSEYTAADVAGGCHLYLVRSAALSASSRAVSLNGWNRHSTAPLRKRVRTDSPVACAVVKTIGISRSRVSIPVEDRGGQGSGKSIVMVLLAKWILEDNANARVAIITDRDELDMRHLDCSSRARQSCVART
jgi:hypothetical protein